MPWVPPSKEGLIQYIACLAVLFGQPYSLYIDSIGLYTVLAHSDSGEKKNVGRKERMSERETGRERERERERLALQTKKQNVSGGKQLCKNW